MDRFLNMGLALFEGFNLFMMEACTSVSKFAGIFDKSPRMAQITEIKNGYKTIGLPVSPNFY